MFTRLAFPLVLAISLLAPYHVAGAPPPTPSGGLGTNSSDVPMYVPMSDFDFASLTLALNQELIELDLFNAGLAQFSTDDFQNAGIGPNEQYLIQWMGQQEVGHAQLLSNILSPNVTTACNYTYPFTTVQEFIDFSMRITRLGESGTFGFLEHLDSRASASLLLEAISTESRQEMIFRQLEGLFPMPFWFTPAITQSMQWSYLAPYISSCPSTNPMIQWQNFPSLNVTNAPNVTALLNGTQPTISNNESTPISQPGTELMLSWDSPGQQVGPNLAYNTSTSAGTPMWAAWISQLNTTYTPLQNVTNNTATTSQPGSDGIFGNGTAPTLNGTIFVLITDNNPFVTPFNLSLLDQHVVAGPALYTIG
ncbi:ferritin-like domain-containing protein [Phanerochaete sordida]|uniref:Ferritin-like domain-containing protein n=1 Tax=Phanerochaete sordida TaxID=48140 RepID=A0A9P3GEJ1_9APHY|nr:ferritin-like domain-containing protein [Phanerochaete sordida]